jgi:2-iminobutanoate/2-iminopropanoate deaminase
MKRIVTPSNAPKPLAPYSVGINTNGTLYVSGQLGINPVDGKLVEGGVEAETRQVLENIGNVLKADNMNYSNIVKCSIFMKDMNDFATINAVYGEYFKENPPAREAVQVACLPMNVAVEISCIAVED